jgi:hypothetical protein
MYTYLVKIEEIFQLVDGRMAAWFAGLEWASFLLVVPLPCMMGILRFFCTAYRIYSFSEEEVIQ